MQVDKENAIKINDLSTIYITGAGFVNRAFKGIGNSSSLGWNETTWGGTLNRGNTFALENIDDVEIGQVAQCQITFPYMNINDFLDLQKILKERYVYVNFFCVDLGKRITKEMAITQNERKTLYARGNTIYGMQNISVKFVATNRDTEYNTLEVNYNSNGGTGSIETQSATYSDQIRLSSGNEFLNGSKYIKYWNTKADGTGKSYGLNQNITLWESLELYAIWE